MSDQGCCAPKNTDEKGGCCAPSTDGKSCCDGKGCCDPASGCCQKGTCCAPAGGCCPMMAKLGGANVGSIDRALRAAGGGALLTLVFVGPQTPWGWLGLLLIFSAMVGWCGAYRVLGIRTNGKGCCK
jgi:hypothetical protein